MNHRVVLAVFMAAACTLAGSAGARPLADAPTILAFTPNHGPPGEKVTIYGHNFTGATVSFGSVPATNVTMDANATHLYVNVPPDVGTGWSGRIVVAAIGGTVSTATNFTVTEPTLPRPIARPRMYSFAPMRGQAGTKVTIKGVNLGGAMWVKFGGVKSLYTVPKSNLIIAHVPKKAHTGRITIKTSTGMTTLAHGFTVLGGPGV